MNVVFSNGDMQAYYEDIRALKKDYSEVVARAIVKRINELQAYESVKVLLAVGRGKPHFLTEDYKHCIGISLSANVRLVIKPVYPSGTDYSAIDLDGLRDVQVLEVVDYHGK